MRTKVGRANEHCHRYTELCLAAISRGQRKKTKPAWKQLWANVNALLADFRATNDGGVFIRRMTLQRMTIEV